MKKILLIMAFALFTIGCGDTTTINGYSEEQVSELLASNKDTVYQVQKGDSVLTYIYVTDTLYKEMVDTIYKQVIDTIVNSDTIYNRIVDTVYTRVIDTVINTLVDTIYTRVIDTVFATLEDFGINTELPRDTTITLYDTTDNQIIAKIYKGIVFKNVFYDTTKYKYNETAGEPYNITIETGWYSTNFYMYSTNRCGLIDTPTWKDFGWEDKDNVRYKSESRYNYTLKRIPGWRLFNVKDANALRDNLDRIISDDSEVYLSTIKEDTKLYNFEANVATQYSTSQASKGKLIKYMCAYDLN